LNKGKISICHLVSRINPKLEIVRGEGFASPRKLGVYLGEEDYMLCGDGPGLLDAYRGAAMDNAATCVRIAVQAVRAAEKSIPPAMTHNSQKMKPLKH
jgi:hypothetical protein